MIALCVLSSSQAWAQTQTTVTVLVRSETVAVEDALVTAGDRTARTDGDGRALLQVAPGVITMAVTKPGFFDVVQTVTVGESDLDLDVELVPTPEVEEEVVVVATTRTGRRVER